MTSACYTLTQMHATLDKALGHSEELNVPIHVNMTRIGDFNVCVMMYDVAAAAKTTKRKPAVPDPSAS